MITINRLLKIVGIFIVSIIFLVIITVVVAKIYEDKLAAFTIEKLENQINAPMSVGKVSLIPLFSFPRISAEINKLYIGDPQSRYNDTLFFINSLKIGLDSWDLINGIYTIDEMEISGLDFDYEVDSAGKSNIDFIVNAFYDSNTETESDTLTSPLDLSADKLKLENIHIKYYDSLNNIGSEVAIPEITIRAKTKNNIYSAKTKGSFVLSHILFKDTRLDKMESCNISFDLEYENNEAVIKKLLLKSEGIKLGIKGTYLDSDTAKLNTKIEAKDLDFDILKRYLPKQYDYFIEDARLAEMETLSIDMDLDYVDNIVDLKRLLINSEGIGLEAKGSFNLKDTLSINTNIEYLNLDIDILKKYIPGQYFQEFGITDVGGIIDVSAEIVGKYADSTLLPMVNADVDLKSIRVHALDYPEINAVNLRANISTGNKSDMSDATIDIVNFEFVSGNSNLNIKGNLAGLENTQYSLRSNMDINLGDFETLIPDSLAKNLQGSIIASVRTSGMLPNKNTNDFIDYVADNTIISLKLNDVGAVLLDSIQVDSFSSNFEYTPQGSGVKEIFVDKLNLKSSNLNLNLRNTSLSAIISGNLSKPQNMSVKIDSLKIKNGESWITGNGTLKNFGSPEFDVKTNIYLSLDEIVTYMPDSLIKNMSGNIIASIYSKGKIDFDSLDVQLFPILFENSSFNLDFNDVSLDIPDSVMNIDSISARIAMDNDILTINNLYGNYNGLNFEIDSTIVRNIYKAVLLNTKEKLYINTHINIGDIIFDDFKHLIGIISSPETDSISSITNATIDTINTDYLRNWTYLIHGSGTIAGLKIDSTVIEDFTVNKLYVDDISLLFKFTDSSYIVDQFKLNVFEGEMNNSLHYKLRDDGTQSVSTHNTIQSMNIRTMLRDLDNFGMDSIITYENISGLLSANLNTFIPINDSVLIDKMMVSGDITLEKGGVYNYAPATDISKFTSIKELDDIQFKTLRSSIFMFKNKLYVPRTNIVSNALDIAAFGMQSMEGDSEYHMEVHLSNILFGKSKRRNKKQDETGEEVDVKSLKKSSQKIKYSVTKGKSKVGPDTKEAREEMMNKIRVQNKMLDFIFFPKNIHYNTDIE